MKLVRNFILSYSQCVLFHSRDICKIFLEPATNCLVPDYSIESVHGIALNCRLNVMYMKQNEISIRVAHWQH